MTNTFFISDTHFGHTNAWAKFKDKEGNPMRPFTSTEEMDETMVANWNSVVSPKDRVYHLGDFCMKRKDLWFFPRLNGRICLVLGNHDIWKRKDYDKYAPNIDTFNGARMLPGLGWVCTHIPVHERQFQGRWTHNIHGHLHCNTVGDDRYFNVSVEQINYTPIELEEIRKLLK